MLVDCHVSEGEVRFIELFDGCHEENGTESWKISV